MPSRARIASTDSGLSGYLQTTTFHFNTPYREAVNQTILSGNTLNIEVGEFVPPYMTVTLENTGAPTDADLLFCMASDGDNACTLGSSILLTPGSSQTVSIKELGLDNTRIFFNVTNADPASSGSFSITFQRNWQRLNLVEEQFLQWKNYAQSWISKYQLTLSEVTKTKAVVNEKNLLRKEFTAFAENILNFLNGNINLTPNDRLIFNLPERDREPSARPAITQAVNTSIKTEAGCTLKFTHRVESDASRSSILAISNGVEIRWIVLDATATAPTQPAQCTHSSIATKSIHTLGFGIENANKKVYAFCRWINTSEPAKSGPWSTLLTATLVG